MLRSVENLRYNDRASKTISPDKSLASPAPSGAFFLPKINLEYILLLVNNKHS